MLRNFPGAHHVRVQVQEEKVVFCEKEGLTLISIPFWWDRTIESLIATILISKPTLFEEIPKSGYDVGNWKSWKPIPNEATVQISGWRNRGETDSVI